MSKEKILIVGGDGFCGWPTALHLSSLGYAIVIVDNLARRNIDVELGVQSLTPIASIGDRIDAWRDVSEKDIQFYNCDVAKQYDKFQQILLLESPNTIIHFGEQRAAPYSMKNNNTSRYTVENNIAATNNILVAVSSNNLDAHIVHLGTMGVYGYSSVGMPIPEGYLSVKLDVPGKGLIDQEILYPTNPGSIYHMTKSLDQIMFGFYAKNYNLRITDLHQGIVWGTQTVHTAKDPALINRFDYDGDFGTVLNRFLMQAAFGYPLTVHGTGGQTRAFIHISDTVKCLELACMNPPVTGGRVQIRNQATETHRVIDLAKMISKMTGVSIQMLDNPRKEAAENDLIVNNESFLGLGLNPTTLSEGLMDEIYQVAARYKERANLNLVPCTSTW